MTALAAAAGATNHITPLTFDIVDLTRSGACIDATSCTATSQTATTTTSGGRSPYTYLWEYVSGDVFTIDTPNSDSTSFSLTNSTTGSPTLVGVYKCTVTDDNSDQASDTVTVDLTFTEI